MKKMKNQINILTIAVIAIFGMTTIFSSCKKDEVLIATSIELVSGADQTSNTETLLANAIVVKVKDQNGNAFQNATVKFTVTEGAVSVTTASTDANGQASVNWTLGTTEGEQNLMVSAFKADGTSELAGSPITVKANANKVLTDVDGNTYKTVKIGNQTWMAENLKTTKYADRTPITKVEGNTEWGNLNNNNTDKAYCYPDNNDNTDYGALYTYAAATNGIVYTTVDVQGVCPDGWHLPNDAEWEELNNYLGVDVAGGKLKEIGTSHWESPNTGATNSTNFTALPAGYRKPDGEFSDIGRIAFWWTSSEETGWSDYGQTWYINYSSEGMMDKNDEKSEGKSVRCIMD